MSLDILAQIPFFSSLPRGELIYLASALRVHLTQPGTNCPLCCCPMRR